MTRATRNPAPPAPQRPVSLDAAFWSTVALVAGARRGVNSAIRFGAHRSRGEQGDRLNDLLGVAGEVIVRRLMEAASPPWRTAGTLLSLRGPVDEPDIVASRDDRILRLECKGFEVTDERRWVNINEVAHERSVGRAAEAYVPVALLIGGSLSVVGRRIPLEAVAGWGRHDYGYGDPCFRTPLAELGPTSFGMRTADLVILMRMAPTAISSEELDAWLRRGMEDPDGVDRVLASSATIEELVASVGGGSHATVAPKRSEIRSSWPRRP